MNAPTISPVQNDTVFALAVSGKLLYAARASGLYRSQDGSATWVDTLASLERHDRFAVTTVAASGRTVVAGATGAILCSEDDGVSWQIVPLPTPAPTVTALAVSPGFAEDGLIAAGTAEDGIFVSTDRGATWIPWNFGLIDLRVNALAISPDFANDRTIFAGTESGVFRSLNGGRAWREIPFPMNFAPVLSLGITTSDRLFAGSEGHGAFASDDGGANWQPVAQLADVAVNAIHVRGSRVWLLSDEVLALSDDDGDTWVNDRRPLPPGKRAMALLPFPPHSAILVGFADGDLLQLP